MLYRCYAQGPGGIESGTLIEDEIAAEIWAPGGMMDMLERMQKEGKA